MGDAPDFFLPVERGSWDDCQDFIRELNSKAQNGLHFKLPSEAHWEYACSGKYDVSGASLAWYGGNSGDGITSGTYKVGTKTPNAWGLYDMHGNVFEWCSDWYGDYPNGDATDPTGPKSGSDRVSRGGALDYDPGDCRSANRGEVSPARSAD